MKMTTKTNIKGMEIELTFEGSIKELMAVNTATVAAAKEWVSFFAKEGDHICDMVEHGIERGGDIEKRIYSKEKEIKYFKSVIDKNMK